MAAARAPARDCACAGRIERPIRAATTAVFLPTGPLPANMDAVYASPVSLSSPDAALEPVSAGGLVWHKRNPAWEKGLHFPLGAGCVITTEPYERRAAFRDLPKPGRKARSARSGRSVGVLSGVLRAARAAQVQVGLQALRLLYVVFGLLLMGNRAGEAAARAADRAAAGERLSGWTRNPAAAGEINRKGGSRRATEDC